MVLTNPVTEQNLSASIARDTEFIEADKAHLNAPHPHSQYLRIIDTYDSDAIAPISLAGNTWKEVGPTKIFGQQGVGATWILQVYMQYVETDGTSFAYYQYCGSGVLGAIFWQADTLTNEGIVIPNEAHNEADFTLRVRLGRGQARKVELKPDRAISIAAPGFLKVSGVRIGL